MHERRIDTVLIKDNLKTSFSLWQKNPQDAQHTERLHRNVELAKSENYSFVLKVKDDILDDTKFESCSISANDVLAYGVIEGGAITFNINSSKDRLEGEPRLSVRVGKIKDKDYLVLTGTSPVPIGWFTSDDILYFDIK